MTDNSDPLHIYFFPMMAPGHMIPLVDMARQFARRKVKATIILTQVNATRFASTIERDQQLNINIFIRQVKFPSAEVGLPEGIESLSSITSSEMSSKFIKALDLLQEPVHQLLKEDKPDCIVSDFFFPWTNNVARELGIPRIIFHGAGFFPLCVYHSLVKHKPYNLIESDSEMFAIPEIPHVIKMNRQQLPNYLRNEHENLAVGKAAKTEVASYGVIVNSFKDLEPDYVEHYKNFIGKKVWHVGPVSLCNTGTDDKAERVNLATTLGENNCLNWLNTKEPNSVVYVCFGTVSLISTNQLREIATGLEASGNPFIWIVKNDETDEGNKKWLPEGFEERTAKNGLIIKGWAEQLLILEHGSVGGFLTHCGWNSLLEGVTAGVPMITWPISSEQFDNEKLVTEILKIGVSVGNAKWSRGIDMDRVVICSENIAKAVNLVMNGEQAMEMRNRASALSCKAKEAVEIGGSSYNDMSSLLDELRLNTLVQNKSFESLK